MPFSAFSTRYFVKNSTSTKYCRDLFRFDAYTDIYSGITEHCMRFTKARRMYAKRSMLENNKLNICVYIKIRFLDRI